jgi:hypothetical protein
MPNTITCFESLYKENFPMFIAVMDLFSLKLKRSYPSEEARSSYRDARLQYSSATKWLMMR